MRKIPKTSARYEMTTLLGLIDREKARMDGSPYLNTKQKINEYYKRRAALSKAEDKLAKLTSQQWNQL